MKNFVLVLVTVLSFSLTTEAANPFINKMSDKTFVLDLSVWKSKNIEVTIKDKNNVVILNEKLASKNGFRKYNLENLADGEYIVAVEDFFKILSQGVDVQHDNIMVSSNTKEVYKPILRAFDGKLDLIYLAQGKEFSLAIVDEKNETVYNRVFENEITFHKAFDLSQLAEGNYIALVYANNEAYTVDFVK